LLLCVFGFGVLRFPWCSSISCGAFPSIKYWLLEREIKSPLGSINNIVHPEVKRIENHGITSDLSLIVQKESTTDRISLSATSDRGLIVHSNGRGRLFQDELDWFLTDCDLTHRVRLSPPHSIEGSITLPSSSTALERLKVAKTVATVSQRAVKAM
jgi:hypothetical protein